MTFKTKKARNAFVTQLNAVRQRVTEGTALDFAIGEAFNDGGYAEACAHIQDALPIKYQRKRNTTPGEQIMNYTLAPKTQMQRVLARLDVAIGNAKTATVTRASRQAAA